uniref:Uncharacterized protein n=1 Tax=Arundo donax TaxID=35708 RepID=A0A0A9F510_ARUDO
MLRHTQGQRRRSPRLGHALLLRRTRAQPRMPLTLISFFFIHLHPSI